ncbi:MAG: serine/threonine-protein kinase PknK, partial [Phototrophicales bacterium]
RGQSFNERTVPYATWREALRTMCLLVDVTDEEAGILMPIVPEIQDLLGRPVKTPQEIDPASAKARLFAAIEAVFAKLTQPCLLILEDIHWASESLELLRRIVNLLPQIPLLLVASFRDD